MSKRKLAAAAEVAAPKSVAGVVEKILRVAESLRERNELLERFVREIATSHVKYPAYEDGLMYWPGHDAEEVRQAAIELIAVPCEGCGGAGRVPDTERGSATCPACDGTGKLLPAD